MELYKQDALDGPTKECEVASPDSSPPETTSKSRLNRRHVIRAGMVSALGLVATQFNSSCSKSRPAKVSTTRGGNGVESLLAQPTIGMLPSSVAADFMRTKLLPDPTFQKFYQYFGQQGFQFIPDRVQLTVSINPADPNNGEAPSIPYLLAIVPSFRPFAPDDPTHQAVSIAVRRGNQSNIVSAGWVTVGHRPYQVIEFGITELDKSGNLVSRGIERSKVQTLSPMEIANELGPTGNVDTSQWGRPASSNHDSAQLAAQVLRNLIMDDYARPLYPSEGLSSLLADIPLIQKWVMVGGLRTNQLVASHQVRYGQALALDTLYCCLFCCCCNGSCTCC